MKFTVGLHTDDGQHHGVTVPDLPGFFSAGDRLTTMPSATARAAAVFWWMLPDKPWLHSLDSKHMATPILSQQSSFCFLNWLCGSPL